MDEYPLTFAVPLTRQLTAIVGSHLSCEDSELQTISVRCRTLTSGRCPVWHYPATLPLGYHSHLAISDDVTHTLILRPYKIVQYHGFIP